MASLYKRNNIIYIAWYDPITKKKMSKSLKLEFTKSNWIKAKQIAAEFEKQLSASIDEYKKLNLTIGSIENAFEHFLRINQNKNKKTIQEYKNFKTKFQTSFNFTDECSVINKNSVEEWLLLIANLKRIKNGVEVPYSNNSKHVYAKVLKKFLGFLFEYNYIAHFRVNSALVPRAEIKPILIYDETDSSKFLEELKSKNNNFKMTMHLLMYTGLRPTDIYNLRICDIDCKNDTISYYSEKTKEFLRVPIHNILAKNLKTYIKDSKLTGDDKLLNYTNASNIGKAFRRYLVEIGLNNKGYTLRTFRKTFISNAHANDVDISTVSKLVGHHNILTTQKYYNKFNILKAKSELAKIKFNNSTTKEARR